MATSNSTSSSVNGDETKKAPSKAIPRKVEEEYTVKVMLNALSEALEANFSHVLERLDELKAQLEALPQAAPSAQPPAQIVFQNPSGFKPFRRRGGGGRGGYGGGSGGRGFPRL